MNCGLSFVLCYMIPLTLKQKTNSEATVIIDNIMTTWSICELWGPYHDERLRLRIPDSELIWCHFLMTKWEHEIVKMTKKIVYNPSATFL